MLYNFKDVAVDLGNGTDFDGEWMFMLGDEKSTIVSFFDLIIEDEEDEAVAKSFGLSEVEINGLRVENE